MALLGHGIGECQTETTWKSKLHDESENMISKTFSH